MGVRKREGGFKLSLVLSRTDLVGRGSPTNQQSDGINKERFTCPGLPGQDREPGLELKAQLLNEREIDNAQLDEHCGG